MPPALIPLSSRPVPEHSCGAIGKHCFVHLHILDGRIIHPGVAVQRMFLPGCSMFFPAAAQGRFLVNAATYCTVPQQSEAALPVQQALLGKGDPRVGRWRHACQPAVDRPDKDETNGAKEASQPAICRDAAESVHRHPGLGRNHRGRTATRPSHAGQLGMRERAAILGGQVNISSAAGKGTTVTA